MNPWGVLSTAVHLGGAILSSLHAYYEKRQKEWLRQSTSWDAHMRESEKSFRVFLADELCPYPGLVVQLNELGFSEFLRRQRKNSRRKWNRLRIKHNATRREVKRKKPFMTMKAEPSEMAHVLEVQP